MILNFLIDIEKDVKVLTDKKLVNWMGDVNAVARMINHRVQISMSKGSN